jgi:hypothetical protein
MPLQQQLQLQQRLALESCVSKTKQQQQQQQQRRRRRRIELFIQRILYIRWPYSNTIKYAHIQTL